MGIDRKALTMNLTFANGDLLNINQSGRSEGKHQVHHSGGNPDGDRIGQSLISSRFQRLATGQPRSAEAPGR